MEMRMTALWQTAPDWLEVIAQVRLRLDKRFLYNRRGLIALAGLVRIRDRYAGWCVHSEASNSGSRAPDICANWVGSRSSPNSGKQLINAA
jgi:hypothetical protein